MAERGIELGHGGMVGVPAGSDLAALAVHLLTFMAEESCGKCVPCRAGSARALALARADWRANAEPLDRVLAVAADASLCAFGQAMPAPIRRLLALAAVDRAGHDTLRAANRSRDPDALPRRGNAPGRRLPPLPGRGGGRGRPPCGVPHRARTRDADRDAISASRCPPPGDPRARPSRVGRLSVRAGPERKRARAEDERGRRPHRHPDRRRASSLASATRSRRAPASRAARVSTRVPPERSPTATALPARRRSGPSARRAATAVSAARSTSARAETAWCASTAPATPR